MKCSFLFFLQRYAADHTTEDAKRIEAEIKLSRMSAYVALCIGACFMPNQIVYIMTKFEVSLHRLSIQELPDRFNLTFYLHYLELLGIKTTLNL